LQSLGHEFLQYNIYFSLWQDPFLPHQRLNLLVFSTFIA